MGSLHNLFFLCLVLYFLSPQLAQTRADSTLKPGQVTEHNTHKPLGAKRNRRYLSKATWKWRFLVWVDIVWPHITAAYLWLLEQNHWNLLVDVEDPWSHATVPMDPAPSSCGAPAAPVTPPGPTDPAGATAAAWPARRHRGCGGQRHVVAGAATRRAGRWSSAAGAAAERLCHRGTQRGGGEGPGRGGNGGWGIEESGALEEIGRYNLLMFLHVSPTFIELLLFSCGRGFETRRVGYIKQRLWRLYPWLDLRLGAHMR